MVAFVDWTKLPSEISQRIRFMQLQAQLQTALESRPKPDVYMSISEVCVGFDREHEDAGGYSLSYCWDTDEYEWFDDDNAYGISTYRFSDGTIRSVDHHTVRYGYPDPLKQLVRDLVNNNPNLA